jgi:hypothetical protein
MQKRIVLLIIFMVLNLSTYSQVIIKDEIVLDGKGLEENSGAPIPMPFYGIVKEFVKCTLFVASQAQVDLIIDGTHYPFSYCLGASCPNLGCWCNGIGEWSDEHILPMGRPVDSEIRKCYGGPDWVPLAYYFEQTTPPPGITQQYYIFAKEPEGEYKNIGTMQFIELTPPGNCPNAGGNYCDSSSWVQVPDVELVPYPNSNIISTYCSKHSNTLAAFSPATDHPSNINTGELTESNVIACYNQILQTWQFNLDQDVNIYYQIGICSTNVASKNITYIDSEFDINDTKIPHEKCYIALRSFEGHKEYKWDPINNIYGLEIPYGGFMITDVILEHENQHKLSYEEFMNNYLFWWETKINTYRAICSTYTDIFEASKGGFSNYLLAYSFMTQFDSEWRKFTGREPVDKLRQGRDEKRTNDKKEVQDLIDKYIKKLKDHCK